VNRPTPAQLATIIGDNIVPVAGVLLLGWKASWLVFMYFAGFLLDIGAILVLLWVLESDKPEMNPSGTAWGAVKGALGLVLAFVVLVGIFAAVFGVPVMAVIYGDPGLTVKGLLANRDFSLALAMHVLVAAHGFVQVHRDLKARKHADAGFRPLLPLRRRFAFVTSRWVVVLAASFFLAIPVVLVIAYCAASIWFELKPP
jgi:hypothetical protein